MNGKNPDLETLDLEAFADGNLSAEDAASVDEKMRRGGPALKKMFNVARINATLRKARKKLYGDKSLSRKIDRIKDK